MKPVKKAIILAGGKGTRLYPVTLEIPKPLLTVNKKPILNYLIEMFKKHGVQEIVVTIRKSDEEDFNWWLKRWKNGFGGISVNFVIEKEPMGTLGYWAHHLYKWTGDKPFFMTNADELKEIDLTNMIDHHEKTGAIATLASKEVANPSGYGALVLDGDYICRFLEKLENPPSNFISLGLYLLEPAVREYLAGDIKGGRKFLMIETDLFPKLANTRKLAVYKSSGRWFDCGNLQRWEKAIKEWDSA